jgi:hypothetical protein
MFGIFMPKNVGIKLFCYMYMILCIFVGSNQQIIDLKCTE